MANRLVFVVLVCTGWILQKFNQRNRTRVGKLIGFILSIPKRRRSITTTNVANAFPKSELPFIEQVVKGAYANLGITLAELLAVPNVSQAELLQQMRIENIGLVRDRQSRGEASILLSAHFGNWEYLAMAAGVEINAPITIVAHPQKNRLVDERLNRYREQFGNKIVPMNQAAKTLVQTLTTGGTVAFLVDQYANPAHNPSVDFFGRPTPTYQAPAALALKYNIPIFYAFAVRQTNGSYVATLRELPMSDLENNASGVVELTRRHVALLEETIRIYPELWSWQHRRWRN